MIIGKVTRAGLNVLGLCIILSAGVAIGADTDSSQEWNIRVAQLGEAGPNDIVLTAVGDAIWTHKLSTNNGAGLQSLFGVMRSSDIAYLNLEQAFADRGFPMPNKDIVRAETSIIDEFVWAGADIVSVANNHAMDYGLDGLETTLQTLDSSGIKYSGAGRNLAESLRPTFIEKNGLNIALLSFMAAPDFDELGIIAATEHTAGVAPVRGSEVRLMSGKSTIAPWDADLQQLEQAIKAAKEAADFVAVSLQYHWASNAEIDSGEQLIARTAIDAGADIILGHGPMMLNGIEFYKGKPIFYTMGSFSFHVPQSSYVLFPTSLGFIKELEADRRIFESMMVRLIVSPQGEFRRIELLPVDKNADGDPHFVAGETASKIIGKLQKFSEPFGTAIKREAWYAVVNLPDNDP